MDFETNQVTKLRYTCDLVEYCFDLGNLETAKKYCDSLRKDDAVWEFLLVKYCNDFIQLPEEIRK